MNTLKIVLTIALALVQLDYSVLTRLIILTINVSGLDYRATLS
jgi:hypothetical protein